MTQFYDSKINFRIQFPVTSIVILICIFLILSKQKSTFWVVPLLIANSCAGFVYMMTEKYALRSVGTMVLGNRVKLGAYKVYLINILTHVIVPIIILSKMTHWKHIDWKLTFLVEILGILFIDIHSVYPCSTPNGIYFYLTLHVLIVTFLTALFVQ